MAAWIAKPIAGIEISNRALRKQNETQLAIEIERFIENYYDSLQLFQLIIALWSVIIIMLGFCNLVPKHEDFRVFIILLLVLIMGFAALFAFYTSFVAFHKPCRSIPEEDSRFTVNRYNLRNLRKSINDSVVGNFLWTSIDSLFISERERSTIVESDRMLNNRFGANNNSLTIATNETFSWDLNPQE
ncbi:hypothetical protein QR98_0034160 [Sarcoptes scabiei]|uniref:Uncharacterized protein n=1 Tax=Sarcoptes scabiei TaxID=52283 RepID=A0A132A3K5_SARSC|nr:hypothetical protein QR98_0034160 [Sarcoptes scabiei]